MQNKTFLRQLLLALALAGALTGSAQAGDEHRRSGGRDDAGWLPIPALVERLEAAGYRNIEEIEREHGRYEVRVTDRNGERRKLHFDARSGAPLGAGRAEGVPRAAVVPAADGRECNRRRCRDDLPAAAAGGARP